MMAADGPKFACALVMFTIMTRVCHAASPSTFCPLRTCGAANDGVEIRFPFRLADDPLSGRCYTDYPYFEFQCLMEVLYLNFTGNISNSNDMYKVTKIDYWNQTLSLVPQGPAATCRLFDASRFGGLNITNTTTLLLDCEADIRESCTVLPGSATSDVCNSTGGGVNDPIVPRWACPMELNNYTDVAFSSCYLMVNDPQIPNHPAARTALALQFEGNRTLSSQNFNALPPAPSLAPALPPATAPTAVVSDDSGKSSKKQRLYIILGVVAGFIAAIIIFLSCMLRWCGCGRHSSSRTTERFRRKNIEAFGKNMKDFNSLLSQKNHPTTLYTLKELEKATKNFSDDMKLGSGGFGTVYKGTLDDGVEVAIKRTNRTVDMKGVSEQFMNEVTLLSQVNHRNLVRLHGCCLEVEVPMLVYEYVPNGDLFQHLQGERPGQKLSWEKRLQIAIDTAEAIRYLHSAASPPIYHRDLKTSNILLDDKFNVKVADFGISRLVKPDATHVSTAVKGTPGYLDPEYFQSFQLTDKSDVFSFGMVLLELVTSSKPVDFQRGTEDVSLKAMALPFIQNGNVKAIVDPRLFDENCAYESFDVLTDQMQRVAELASKCLADHRHDRPSMKEVVAELVAIRGVENRAGRANEISDMDQEGVTVPVLESRSFDFTSSSDSSYTAYSKSPTVSEVNRQN